MKQARWLFIGVGLALSLLAIKLEDRRLTWIAIGFLGASLVVRVISRRRADQNRDNSASS